MGDVVAGAAGGVLAGVGLTAVLLGGVPLEGLGGAVALGGVVPLVAGAGDPGGEVARGGGQGGKRLLADNSFNCDSASSRVPAGSPANTCARAAGRRSCNCIVRQSR